MSTNDRQPEAIEAALRLLGDPARAVKEKAYLKSERTHLGVGMPGVRRIAKVHAKALRQEPLEATLALAEALYARDVFELRVVAVELLTAAKKRLGPAQLPLLERMLRDAHTWALVDALAVTVVGAIVEAYGEESAEVLDRWAEDDDFWIRRASMLALLSGLRRGEGDFARFARYADAMLEEKEFFIRKAIGWVLREHGRKCPEVVDAFIAPRTHRASGVTMREVTKHMPEPRKSELMDAYRARRPANR